MFILVSPEFIAIRYLHVMKKSPLILLILLLMSVVSFSSFSQSLQAGGVRRAYYEDGAEVKNGDTLRSADIILLKKKGSVYLYYSNGYVSGSMRGPRTISIDSLISNDTQLHAFQLHDRIFRVLLQNHLRTCHPENPKQCMRQKFDFGCNRPGKLYLPSEPIKAKAGETVQLAWKDAVPNSVKRYILISSLFEDYLDIFETIEQHFVLDLKRYPEERALQYRIITNDCRESDSGIIHIE